MFFKTNGNTLVGRAIPAVCGMVILIFFSNQMTGGTTRSVQHWGTGIWRFPSFLCGSLNTSKYLNVKMMLITWKWFNPFST
jgi:hypothetical protein